MKKITILLLILSSPIYAKIDNSLLIRDFVEIGSLTISSPGNFNFLNVIGNANIGGSLNVQGSLTINGVPIRNGGSVPDVVGPTSPTTAGAVALFTDTTGKAIEQSAAPVTVDPSANDMSNINNLTVTADINLPATATNYSQGVITINGGAPFIHAVGFNNTALGQAALQSVSGGGDNTAIGFFALGSLATGNLNVGIGSSALSNNVSGNSNVAIGLGALELGGNSDNIGIGFAALVLTRGSQNVGIGSNALSNLGSNTSISNNIALGYNAGVNLNNTAGNSNNIYIGSLGPASLGAESATTRIGSTTQTACFIAGINGATSSGGTAVLVNSSGQLGTTTSSICYKKDITTMEHIIAQLMRLRPVRFRYKIHDETITPEYGLIAEEVAQVMPDLVIYKDGNPETVKYHVLPAILIKALQELAIQNNELRQSIEQFIQQHSGAV